MGYSDSHGHSHPQNMSQQIVWVTISFFLMCSGIVFEHFNILFSYLPEIKLFWYGIPCVLIMIPVMKEMLNLLFVKRDFFNELTLMFLATIGAFFIRQYSEGLGVMVFYTIGEIVQDLAVQKAKSNIKDLLDVRPDKAFLLRDDGDIQVVKPEEVAIGSVIEVRSGERVPIDGVLISESANFNAAALTGESIPLALHKNDEVLSGMCSKDRTVRLCTTRLYEESTLSCILKMVEEASEHKSPTERFIRKFARIYTPVVFFGSLSVAFVPYFFDPNYLFATWFYRSLVFLVISCPCALVISVPLGYFGGIGLGSRFGILFKGGNYLEAMSHLHTIVTDKTGTITKGVFSVQNLQIFAREEIFLSYLFSIEKHSTHPIALAICAYCEENGISKVELIDVQEKAGIGLKAVFDGKELLAGNVKLLREHNIEIPKFEEIENTLVFCAYGGEFLGFVSLSDELKTDAQDFVDSLKKLGINLVMLSGDKQQIVDSIAKNLGIPEARGDLLPEGKVSIFQDIKAQSNNKTVAFLGDGINDAPVLALSDVGIAMGSLGSDLAIETADLVIQTDEPSKVIDAIRIAKATRLVIIQNISLAMAVKLVVFVLGFMGMATMWEAIFSDVGVSLLATLNSAKLLYYKI